MVIYVDESGIHKTEGHSCFALVYVMTEQKELLEKAIVEIEQRLRISLFHWTDLPWKLRASFIQEIAVLPFSVKVALFQNPINQATALEWALRHVLIEKQFQSLYVDGKKPKWVERQLKKVLRDSGISVKKLKTVRQGASPGIRLADAIAGLCRTYYDAPEGRAGALWSVVCKKITTQLVGGQRDR